MSTSQIQQLKICFAQQVDYIELDGQVRSVMAADAAIWADPSFVLQILHAPALRRPAAQILFDRLCQTQESLDNLIWCRWRRWKAQESCVALLHTISCRQWAEGLLKWQQQVTCPQVTPCARVSLMIWIA